MNIETASHNYCSYVWNYEPHIRGNIGAISFERFNPIGHPFFIKVSHNDKLTKRLNEEAVQFNNLF